MSLQGRRKLIIAFLFVVAFVCGMAAIFYHQSRPRRLNVVIITLDALRADHLGCYGYQRNTSPNMDRLAREGVMFSMAISQSNWTGGALASLLTSTYPSTHQIRDWRVVLSKRLTSIVEVLKNEKYVTACLSGGGRIYKYLPGLANGFDHFFDAEDVPDLFKQVVGWIQSNRDNNFFLWIHVFDHPHAPYDPPPPFNRMFMSNSPPRNLPISKDKEQCLSRDTILSWVAVNNIKDTNYYISQYDGEIALVDSSIGMLLDALKKEGVDKNTVVIISSDHGESLGERGVYFQHGDCLYNQEIRVPLIINGSIIPRGRVIKYPVQLVDVMPSVADILGIKLNTEVEGKSLFPFASNKKNCFAFSEAEVTKIINGTEMNVQDKAIISGSYKLIYEKDYRSGKVSYELYNLETDPGELHDLAQAEKEKFKFLKKKLEAWMCRPRLKVVSKIRPLGETDWERLRALGYLQ